MAGLREGAPDAPRDNSMYVAGGIAAILAFFWTLGRIPELERNFALALIGQDRAAALSSIAGQLLLVMVAAEVAIIVVGEIRGRPREIVGALAIAGAGVFAPFVFAFVQGWLTLQTEHRVTAQIAALEEIAGRAWAGDIGIRSSGDMAAVERLVKTDVSGRHKDGAEYRMELQRLDFPGFARLSRIAKDRGLKKTIAKVIEMRAIERRYAERDEIRLVRLRDTIAGLAIDDQLRSDLVEALARIGIRSARRLSWNLEDRQIAHLGSAVEILARTEGRWRIADGKILFARREDMAAYGAEMDAIPPLEAEQRRLNQAARRVP
jgi:hypothetical protein